MRLSKLTASRVLRHGRVHCELLLISGWRPSPAFLFGSRPFFTQPCFLGRAGNAGFFPRPRSPGNTQNQIPQLGQAIFDVFRLITIAIARDKQFAAFVNAPAITV